MMTYTGHLTGTGEFITSSARYIVYDHKSGLIYLSTGDRQLALDVLRRQRRRERHGDYNAYELVDDSWCEMESRLARRTAWTSPPFFLLLLQQTCIFS